MATTSTSSLLPLLPSRTPTPRRLLPFAAAAAPPPPRPFLVSSPPPPAPRARLGRRGGGLRRAAAGDLYGGGGGAEGDGEDGEMEEEYYEDDDGEEDWEDDEDEGEEMDVEAMEEEAIGAVADLSARLSRELRIDDDVRDKRRTIRDKTSASKHIPDNLLPRVAIIGRPNVGKSALFNRLVGGNRAIVVDEPGVTRDRLYGRSYWGDQEFMVIDTGGVITLSKSQAGVMEELAITTTVGMDGIPLASREAAIARMPSMIEKQAVAAVDEAAVDGLVAADIEIADWLRRNYSDKRIILAVNKCESPRKGQMQALDFWSLGFSPLPISAITGTGTGELLGMGLDGVEEDGNYIPAIAIVGRPNVGKSSILNALVGEDRTIVSPVSGTTRDAIDTEFTTEDGQKYKLIDTAGIRRRAAVASAGSTTETLSVKRAFRAIRRSDVVALVVEAMACITEQDYKIAERIEKEGKACVIVVNKWDTIPNKNHQSTTYYEQDAAIRPPTFVFFVNDAKLFPETYRRYMEKKLRSDAGFPGTPIRLLWRSRKRPDKKGKSADNSLQSSVIPSKMALAT
uniref:GTPase Der n=1 Tax=Oryza punctata TaxID=4537 RepID=A0A0E0MHI2_ORYPU